MAESAYDHLVGEFVWVGINPLVALKLAAQLYPDEELIIEDKATLEAYVEMIMVNIFFAIIWTRFLRGKKFQTKL